MAISKWMGQDINTMTGKLYVLGKSPADWYSDINWYYRTPIVIDKDQVDVTGGNHTDIPVLISSTNTNWRHTGSGGNVGKTNGGDILFTDSDGQTKLKHEIQRYTSSSGQLIAWVKIPTLSNSADKTIYMYYGYSGAADQQDQNGTWNSNYKAVYHLIEADAVGYHYDSTSNGNTGTRNYNNRSTGKIGYCHDFDGNGDYINIPDDNSLDITASLTVEAWIDPYQVPMNNWGCVCNKREVVSGSPYNCWTMTTGPSGNDIRFYVTQDGGGGPDYGQWEVDGGSIDTTWRHIVGRYDGTGNDLSIWINGSEIDNRSLDITLATSGLPMRIGSSTGSGNWFDGKIDEVRVSATAHTDGYIKTVYNNTNAPGTFYSLSAEENLGTILSQLMDVDIH